MLHLSLNVVYMINDLSFTAFYNKEHAYNILYGQKYWHKINLAVGKINHVSPNFLLPTFNTFIKKS